MPVLTACFHRKQEQNMNQIKWQEAEISFQRREYFGNEQTVNVTWVSGCFILQGNSEGTLLSKSMRGTKMVLATFSLPDCMGLYVSEVQSNSCVQVGWTFTVMPSKTRYTPTIGSNVVHISSTSLELTCICTRFVSVKCQVKSRLICLIELNLRNVREHHRDVFAQRGE